MEPTSDTHSFGLPPALLAEVEAAADEEHRPVAEVVREALERYLAEGRGKLSKHARADILARVDAAEASIARGKGIPITQASMRRLAADVKQRGRARMERRRAAAPSEAPQVERTPAEAAARMRALRTGTFPPEGETIRSMMEHGRA